MSDLHQRVVQASPPRGQAPIGVIRDRVQRRSRRRRGLVASGAVAVLVGAALTAAAIAGPDVVQVGTSGRNVEVPDVTGLPVAEAKQVLKRAGLKGAVVSGYVERDGKRVPWSDPDGPDAVVAAHEPPAGSRVPRGSVVGLRTAAMDRELCSVFTEIPPRRGDAEDLASTEGFFEMLREARPYAQGAIADAINQLLAHHDAGGSVADAPSLTLDRVAVQHDACSRANRSEGAGGSSASEAEAGELGFCPDTRHATDSSSGSSWRSPWAPPSACRSHPASAIDGPHGPGPDPEPVLSQWVRAR